MVKKLDSSFFGFVTMHAFDRQTDEHGRTDRILIARPRLHSMQRGKSNCLSSNHLSPPYA